MDVIKFVKQRNRLCDTMEDCDLCPLKKNYNCVINDINDEKDARETVKIIEKWIEAHPRKTKQDDFLKLFPNAMLDEYGVLTVCPQGIDSTVECNDVSCFDCTRGYWMQEVVG